LNIEWIAAHSPQAKGRIERAFQTAQDRLVKGLRQVGANDLDTGNTFIAGHNPLDYLKALSKYMVHCHIKDVSPALAAAARGEETGIGSSEVYVGGGVNNENIRKCMEYFHQTDWAGVVSLECSGTGENTRKSVEWMRGVVKGLKKGGSALEL